jgi:hypothetical protein
MTYGDYITKITNEINKIHPPRIREFIASEVLKQIVGATKEVVYLDSTPASSYLKED